MQASILAPPDSIVCKFTRLEREQFQHKLQFGICPISCRASTSLFLVSSRVASTRIDLFILFYSMTMISDCDRPKVSGEYISSAFADGVVNVPGVVALIT